MATIGTSTLSEVWRIKYAQSELALGLRTMQVAEDIALVDRSDSYYIAKPYLTAATAAIAALAGTYSVSTAVTTDETLTITDQVTYAVHLLAHEEQLTRVDLFANVVKDMKNAIGVKADQFVLNTFANGAGSSYTTPAGGFTTFTNIPQIIAELTGKVSGYDMNNEGMYLVIENTDLPGFIQAGMTNGFNYADATLNNGWSGNIGNVRVYVVRSGTFVTATLGSLSATNSGKRLFGIRRQNTYAAPRGIQYDEKKVTLKTGREVVGFAHIGAKVWTQTAPLTVLITLA